MYLERHRIVMKNQIILVVLWVLLIFFNGCATSSTALDTLDQVEKETSEENAQKQVDDVENVKKKYDNY